MTWVKTRICVLCFIAGLFIFVSPLILIAGGGDFQQRIKDKINTRKNIQFNLDNLDQKQGWEEGNKPANYLGQQEISQQESLEINAQIPIEEKRERRVSREMSPAPSIFSSYAIYKTDYRAEIEDNVATIKGNVTFEVFKKGLTQLPLVKSNVGLIDVSINKGASFVTMQSGKYYLIIDKPGKYTLDIEFLIKAARERENGPGSFSFEVLPAPISQFEFMMPESGVEIFVEPSIKLEVKREPKKTIAWAVMPNTDNITVRWTKALPKEEIAPVKLEPKIYADTATYASVGEGLIRCQTALTYSILQSEVSNLRIVLPEDTSVLEVQGRDLRDWKVSNKDGQQYLDIYLNFGVKGNYNLNLSYERKIGEGSGVAEVPWVRALGAEREKGFFGLAAATNVELAVNKFEHANLIDVKELPSSIWANTANPILLAFKYLSHPFSVSVEVTRHEELPVLVAAIDSADYITLETDEGKSLTKAVYQIRNNVKQFIRVVLPSKNASLWSVFVAAKPVKPAKDKNGNILIPLEKSQMRGESLTQFPVEIVYLDQLSKMGPVGRLRLNLPQVDIPISNLAWSVYLPLDYGYFNFDGDVKRLRRMPAAWGLAGALESSVKASRTAILGKGDYDSVQQYAPQQSAGNFYNEMQSAQMKGVLPIKIDIPRQGKLYYFSKLLVTEKESPWFSVIFVTVFKQFHGLFWFLVWMVIFIFLGIFIKRKIKRKL